VVGLERRWGSFRRGTELHVAGQRPHDLDLRVRTPPHLYPPLVVQAMGSALRAAVDCAGGRRTQVDGETRSPTEIAYRIRWG